MSEAELPGTLRHIARWMEAVPDHKVIGGMVLSWGEASKRLFEAADALTASLAREGEMRREADASLSRMIAEAICVCSGTGWPCQNCQNFAGRIADLFTKRGYTLIATRALASPAPSSGEEKSHGSSAAERNIPRNAHDGKETEPQGRDYWQARVSKWCADAFGPEHATNIEQRGLRLVEEAIEAAQAAGCGPIMLHKLIDYIYEKPAGALKQELGGVGLCVLLMANAAGFSADDAERFEINRVMAKPLSFFAERNKVKNDAGFVAGYCAPLSTEARYSVSREEEQIDGSHDA